MAGDIMTMLRDLEVMTSTLLPDADITKLKIRYEEILNNYEVTKRTPSSLDNDMMDNIKFYISSKRLEGLSELTLSDYYRELVLMDHAIKKPTVSITTADIRMYLSTEDENMVSTKSKKLSVIKTFFGWLVDEEIILKNPANRIRPMKQPKRLPKALSAIELEQLREACHTLRERAMLEVMYSTGCRLSEISNMLLSKINWVSNSMTVIGKGDKERVVYLNPKARYHLENYLEYRETEGDDCEYVFATARRPYRKMSNKTIQDEVNKIASRTTIDKNITPHVFRHTMATLAIDNGIELGDLQQLLGHNSPSTTLRYTSVSEERKRNAHKRFVQ